ncbi:fumarate hydratase subunit alpha [Caldicoprobacter guelmensis]|uniref:fumarate hydratase n=1 Tax=Caldicoprobacter guelmensis TaxID=1170224 RepID=UPI00195DB94D|nr:fumarate hydratase [Caldicoprobacter guelmensis]MBM7582509.1 fumarate hydratase subunit alpha [Caldicoprobacter guelmensis]
MKEIHVSTIIETVARLCIEACYNIGDDVRILLEKAKRQELSPYGKNILDQLLQNLCIAHELGLPICQDTGMAVVFLEIGQDVHIVGGSLCEAVNEGVRRGYKEGYLRNSVLHPITRINTGDNTPAVIHAEIVSGDGLKIVVVPKGFGSENMSQLKMLKPSDGLDGIKQFILQTVIEAGGNPCPPIIVGVGIGGTMEKAAYMAKKALLRPAGQHNPEPLVAQLEEEMLQAINNTGIGPQGLGGTVTALAVHIETYPTHIAGLPVAVNIQCHAARHAEALL